MTTPTPASLDWILQMLYAAKCKAEIDAMSHEELCYAWRFNPTGHYLFVGEIGSYATRRLHEHFGGFTPEISKKIGWDAP